MGMLETLNSIKPIDSPINKVMNSTYCDNEELKKQIICSRPSSDGLFVHELAMISYAEIGQINADNPSFSSIFRDLDVLYPTLLLISLVQRGYIQIQKSINNLSFYRTAELQKFARKHGLKRPNNRDKMVVIITDAYSEEEIDEELPLSFYLPTKKGYTALQNANYSLYPRNQDEEPILDGEPVKENEIEVHYAVTEGVYICTEDPDKWQYYLIVDGIKMRVFSTICNLPKRSDIYVSKDGVAVYSAKNIDVINFYYVQRKLIFRTLVDPEGYTTTPAYITCFDLNKNNIEYSTFDSGDPRESLDSFDTFIRKKTADNHLIKNNYQIFYYVSIKNKLIEQIISSFTTNEFEPITMIPLDNYMDDKTINTIIVVDIEDHDSRNLVQYMLREHLLEEISTFGIPIREIAFCLYCKSIIDNSANITTKTHYREDYLRHKECAGFLEIIEKKDKKLHLLNSYIWKFPCEIFQFEPFRNYSQRNDYNWTYAKQHESELRKEFNKHVLTLKEAGTIPTKWVSELSLFFSIRAIFSDSIYQFRAEWLHLQSIDIFIPSKKTGIEYQGIQHYKPVERFGGEVGLKRTQERDRHKAFVCKENGIQLLEWNYQIPVSEKNVEEFLKEHHLI